MTGTLEIERLLAAPGHRPATLGALLEMDRARRMAGLDAGQSQSCRQRREAVRAYYAGALHLHGGAATSNDTGDERATVRPDLGFAAGDWQESDGARG